MSKKFVHNAHPNLRAATRLKLASASGPEPCDMPLLRLPRGQPAARIDELRAFASRIVDPGTDSRLRDPAGCVRWYGPAEARGPNRDGVLCGMDSPEIVETVSESKDAIHSIAAK